MDFSGRGLVYDSAFNSFASLEKAVKLAKEAGMTDIQVVAVHNDAITAFSNTVNRGVCTGRFLSLDYFTEEEMMGKERFERMIDEVWSHAADDVRRVETKNCSKVAIM